MYVGGPLMMKAARIAEVDIQYSSHSTGSLLFPITLSGASGMIRQSILDNAS
jgi:hypothetical protein